MPDEKLPLIIHPGSRLARMGPQSGRIVTEMVSAALALSRAAESSAALVATKATALVPRFRVGEHEFCEPDYQQILLWAGALELEPEAVIERLLKQEDVTQFANGRIIQLGWNIGLLPLDSFEWVDDLIIESIVFFVPEGHKSADRTMSLRLPELRLLDRRNVSLTSLDLSEASQLTELWRSQNKLTEVDLSKVSRLTELWCYDNQLTKLCLSAVPKLTVLRCDDNRIRSLDLSTVPQLTKLSCRNNQLSELNLSSVPRLTLLLCEKNEFTELDIHLIKKLEMFYYDRGNVFLIQRPDQCF